MKESRTINFLKDLGVEAKISLHRRKAFGLDML